MMNHGTSLNGLSEIVLVWPARRLRRAANSDRPTTIGPSIKTRTSFTSVPICVETMPAGTVALRGSAEFTHWVVWTVAGKDFVCLEPWTCPGNALNTGDRLTVLAPGATRSLWLEISWRSR